MLASVSRSLAGGTPHGGSRWSALAGCPREYYWRHVAKLTLAAGRPGARSATGGGLLGGSLLHALLASYWETTRVTGHRPDPSEVKPDYDEAASWLEVDEKTYGAVWDAFERWEPWARDTYGHWEPVAVEVPLEVAYRVPGDTTRMAALTAKVDLVVRDTRNGQLFAADHKIASAERGSLEASYRIAPEVLTTALCARDGTVTSGAGWPGMAEGAALRADGSDGATPGERLRISYQFVHQVFLRKSPPPGRGSSFLPRSEPLDAYRDQMVALATAMPGPKGIRSEIAWPPRGIVSGACKGWGVCEYQDLCASGLRARGLYREVEE